MLSGQYRNGIYKTYRTRGSGIKRNASIRDDNVLQIFRQNAVVIKSGHL
jgi:hypothetical protein